MGEIDYRVLGTVEVIREGELLNIDAPRQRAVLATLLLQANHVVSIDALTRQLWGETPPAKARNTVQSLILRLRKALTPNFSGRGNTLLLTRHPGYVLRVRPGELDLDRHQLHAAQGHHALAAGQPDRAAQSFREALLLWRGEPLVDVAGVGLQQIDAPRLRELRLHTLERRIDADLMLGRHAELISELMSLSAEHTLREQVHARLMLALYRAGRQAEALDVYHALRHRLVRDLAVEPALDVQWLYQRILTHDTTLMRDTRLAVG